MSVETNTYGIKESSFENTMSQGNRVTVIT